MVETDSTFFERLEQLICSSTDNPEHTNAADVLAEIGSPSTSIAVLHSGNISSHCISSLGDNEETLFQACSISKPTAGLAIMKLIELGHLSLGDKICDLVSSEIRQLLARDAKTESLLQKVTVKQLMSHTAGLSVHGFPGYSDHSKVPSLTQVIEGKNPVNTQAVKFISLPGTEFIYSGGGIQVLQSLIAQVMKMPFPDIMKQYLFEPLGMTRSFYNLSTNEKNVAKAYYTGYTPCESEWHVLPEQAAGGLWTTPTDLLKLLRAAQESLEGDNPKAYLKPDTAKTMLTQVKGDMCLTWFADSTAFGHGGSNMPGYRCFLFGYADLPWNSEEKAQAPAKSRTTTALRQCGFSVMTNSATGDPIYAKIFHAVTYLKKWPQFSFFYGNQATTVPLRLPDMLPEGDEWKEWIGNDWSEKWIVQQDEKGRAVAGIDEQALIVLRPGAIPSKHYGEGRQSIDLVLDGTHLMLRLGWDGSERVIELWKDPMDERSILRREKK